MELIPQYLTIVFILTTLLTIALFGKATKHVQITTWVIGIWLLFQAIVGYSGFYRVTNTFPPRLVLLVLPPLLLTAFLFTTAKGKSYIDALQLKWLTLMHIIRIPVELVLYGLFTYQAVPELMTFEGRNLDIISGISAPVVYYWVFVQNKFSKALLLWWNIICLVLLLNIVMNAILSAPSPIQQFAFTQPNIAVQYFPFNWLPSVVVPLVLFAHLASIRKLLAMQE
ncbi:MAG: hypothetical protein MUE96_12445 [Bacteroidia bacterium]|jgi:hypothetical protein|nr:hypothetical protein [Bacteroidia bacterium]